MGMFGSFVIKLDGGFDLKHIGIDKNNRRAQIDNTIVKVLALHLANLGSFHGIPCGLPSQE